MIRRLETPPMMANRTMIPKAGETISQVVMVSRTVPGEITPTIITSRASRDGARTLAMISRMTYHGRVTIEAAETTTLKLGGSLRLRHLGAIRLLLRAPRTPEMIILEGVAGMMAEVSRGPEIALTAVRTIPAGILAGAEVEAIHGRQRRQCQVVLGPMEGLDRLEVVVVVAAGDGH